RQEGAARYQWLCVRTADRASSATADRSWDPACENDLASLGHFCARSELDLFAGALAQLLKGACCSRWPRLRKSRRIPPRSTTATATAKSVSIRVYLWLIWRHANPGHRRCRLYRVASCREAAQCGA